MDLIVDWFFDSLACNADAFAKQSHLMPLVRRRDGDIHIHRLWKRDDLSVARGLQALKLMERL